MVFDMKSFTSFAAVAVHAVVATSSLEPTYAFVPNSSKSRQIFTPKTSEVVLSSISLDQVDGATTNGATGSTMGKTVASAPKIAQRWRKSTKQLATLGPASSSREMIEKLFLAGADVFRLNFSHGSQEQKKELLDTIRSVEEQYSHPIAALGDLQGPKLRVRVFLFFRSKQTMRLSFLCFFLTLSTVSCVKIHPLNDRLENSLARLVKSLKKARPFVSTSTRPRVIKRESCFLIQKLLKRLKSDMFSSSTTVRSN